MSNVPFASIEGRFYRITRADRAHLVLQPPRPMDCGRYHAPGQTALSISPTAEWARVAVSGYMGEDGLARVIFPLLVSMAHVLDLRDETACLRLGVDRERANVSWRKTLAAGGRPPFVGCRGRGPGHRRRRIDRPLAATAGGVARNLVSMEHARRSTGAARRRRRGRPLSRM